MLADAMFLILSRIIRIMMLSCIVCTYGLIDCKKHFTLFTICIQQIIPLIDVIFLYDPADL